MNLVSHLSQRITPLVISKVGSSATTGVNNHSHTSEALLLEQFYALMIARLVALAADDSSIGIDTLLPSEKLQRVGTQFNQLWANPSEADRLVELLATTYALTGPYCKDLITSAQPLAYQELIQLSHDEQTPLVVYLDQYIPMVRSYIIPTATGLVGVNTGLTDTVVTPNDPITTNNGSTAEVLISPTDSSDIPSVPLNPNDHAQNFKMRGRGNKNTPMLWWLLLPAVLGLAALAWWGLTQYQSRNQGQLEAQAPAEIKAAPAEQTTKAAESLIGPSFTLKMDVDQRLYDCKGAVGSAEQQSALIAMLQASLGEQAAQCQIEVDPNVDAAKPLPPALSNIVPMITPISFATMNLQGNIIRLSAPDAAALQQLSTNIQAIAPSLTVEISAPPAMPMNNIPETGLDQSQNPNAVMEGQGYGDNNMTTNIPNTVNSGSMSSDSALPPSASSMAPTYPSPVPSTPSADMNTAPPGPISQSELDGMLNTVIVAEPANGGRPIQSQGNP
ncbi:MAG: hypothetical protein Q4P13_06265 [Psychrobacter sp.]|nr:hypothetical protein [Psychrobacter sp.]